MANTSPSDLNSFVVAASKIRFSIHEIASELRRLGHKSTTPVDVENILRNQGCHENTIIRSYEWNRWTRRYAGILVIDNIPTDMIVKVMKKRGNVDVTKEKIEKIEIHYQAIISALKKSGTTYGEGCEEYIRQANEMGFLMRDISIQLEKAGFKGITRETIRDVLVKQGYNYGGAIPGRLGTIRMGRPTDKRSENYVTSAYIMGISIEDLAFQLHGLGFECNCHNYVFNTLADHTLIPMEDSTKSSSAGDIPPLDLGEPKDDYDLPELQGYGTISNV
ncbi:hypothetical protein MMC31_002801 [Peltigera leucophlebia]|nr:hypothetical protein [Peltigera leucophlebia]